MWCLQGALLGCLLALSLAKELPKVNTVAFIGSNVTFTCWAAAGTASRVQWYEYASTEFGSLISDGVSVLPGHPNAARFSINASSPLQYDLTIHDVSFEDGGRYRCLDASPPAGLKQREDAELIVIGGPQVCTSSLPAFGAAIEGTYYTYECIVDYGGNIPPNMRWEGPTPFGQAQSDNGVRVWNGLSFYASRTMTTQFWTSSTNFTDSFLPVDPDTATNVPTYAEEFSTPRITVNWPPQGMYADPVKPLNEYLVGDTLECFADAFPTASFEWHNLRTNARIEGSILTIPDSWEGFDNEMRCDAYNVINGFRFNREHHIQVNVPIPPTIPTTTPPTTTTPPPAVSNCFNLEGRWQSTQPLKAIMCVEVNQTSGAVHGVLRNDTDSYWMDLIGSTSLQSFDHISFAGIWAENRAVSTFIGECNRCLGVESLLVSAISRSKGGPPCGSPGQIFYSQEYEFRRDSTVRCPPITIPVTP